MPMLPVSRSGGLATCRTLYYFVLIVKHRGFTNTAEAYVKGPSFCQRLDRL
jgi:hypothetical protein